MKKESYVMGQSKLLLDTSCAGSLWSSGRQTWSVMRSIGTGPVTPNCIAETWYTFITKQVL